MVTSLLSLLTAAEYFDNVTVYSLAYKIIGLNFASNTKRDRESV